MERQKALLTKEVTFTSHILEKQRRRITLEGWLGRIFITWGYPAAKYEKLPFLEHWKTQSHRHFLNTRKEMTRDISGILKLTLQLSKTLNTKWKDSMCRNYKIKLLFISPASDLNSNEGTQTREEQSGTDNRELSKPCVGYVSTTWAWNWDTTYK